MTQHAVGIRYPPSLSVTAIMMYAILYAERLKGARSSTRLEQLNCLWLTGLRSNRSSPRTCKHSMPWMTRLYYWLPRDAYLFLMLPNRQISFDTTFWGLFIDPQYLLDRKKILFSRFPWMRYTLLNFTSLYNPTFTAIVVSFFSSWEPKGDFLELGCAWETT